MVLAARTESIRLRLLGSPALISHEAAVPLAVPQKAIALLVLLIANHATPLSRLRLAESLWPDVMEDDARANLRRHLHLLGRKIGSGALILTKNSAQWNDTAAPSDVAAFERYARDPQTYERAAALWNGDLATGVHDDALTEIRDRFIRQYATALRSLTQTATVAGEPARALQYLERLSALDPLDEHTAREIMRLRAGCGDRTGALAEYNALVQRLRLDLDVEPEPETSDLFQQILHNTREGAPHHNVIAAPTSFVGRECELGAIADALLNNQVVTVVGPAGVGKTRLASRSAMNQLDRYADGVWLVDLTPARGRSDVRSRTAQALDVSGNLAAGLQSKHLLIIFDNCEHVWEHVRALVDELAETGVHTLATSRRRLECRNEHVLVLEPLPLPADRTAHRVSEAVAAASVRLFVERAAAVFPSFRLGDENVHTVVDIVRRVDGLPLAIELVAGRAGLLTAEGMLKRLDGLAALLDRDRTTRHSTLRAALEWSHELLSPKEREVFAHLSVFSGTFSLDAAQHVCKAALDDVLAPLSELVESSLVQARHAGEFPRFTLLDTVRTFAAERLSESQYLDSVRDAHAYYYAELARGFASQFTGSQEVEAYRRCDLDADNFMAALRWIAGRNHAVALDLVSALWRYWIFRWSFEEPRAILERLMNETGFANETAVVRAKALQAAGMFEKERAEAPRARAFFEQALYECRAGGSTHREVEVLTALAILEFNHGNPRSARSSYEACLELQQRAGDVKDAAETIANLGAVAQSLGEDELAIELFGRALEGFRVTNNARGTSYALRSLALSYETLGRFEEAIRYGRDCVAAYEALDEQARLADGLQTLANVLSSAGRSTEATPLLARALGILSHVEHRIFTMLTLFAYAVCSQRLGDHLESARAFAKAIHVRETDDLSLSDSYRAYLEATRAQVRCALGERQFDLACADGIARSIGQFAEAAREREKSLDDGPTR